MMTQDAIQVGYAIVLVLGWILFFVFNFEIWFTPKKFMEQSKEDIQTRKYLFEYRRSLDLQLLENPKYIWWPRLGLFIYGILLVVFTYRYILGFF